MLIEYTHLSQLSAPELQRLKALVCTSLNEGPMRFEGKFLSLAELNAQKQIWENEARTLKRMSLFG